MKLYYSPGACSFASHLVLKELALPYELVKVDLATHTFEGGQDFYTITPKGLVPVLVLENGTTLTETPAIMQYLADLRPESGLVPKEGTFERYELQAWLNFLSSEIHKSYQPFFMPDMGEACLSFCRKSLLQRHAFIDRILEKQAYLLGDCFTVADAFFFTTLGWSQFAGLNFSPLKHIAAFEARVASRPSVKAARAAEALFV